MLWNVFLMINLSILEFYVFWLIKFFKRDSNLKICYYITCKLHKSILHYNRYSIQAIFSGKLNLQCNHFLGGVDLEFYILYCYILVHQILCIYGQHHLLLKTQEHQRNSMPFYNIFIFISLPFNWKNRYTWTALYVYCSVRKN